jgi:cobalt/nickel transport system permease protein
VSSSHDPGAELLIPADTPVHRLAPQCKVAATALFVLAVACTPREVFWPYAWYGVLLAAVAVLAQLPPLTLLRRLVVEVPFLLFVLALPLLGQPPHVDVLGVGLSVIGLQAAASIALKASFGLLATGVLAATTPLPEIITGLERLRVPRLFTAVAAFMVRYTEVLLSELARLRTARACRGGDTRWLWQAPASARCSCGPSSGASGSTSRWPPAATRARCPTSSPALRRRARRGRRRWPSRCWRRSRRSVR